MLERQRKGKRKKKPAKSGKRLTARKAFTERVKDVVTELLNKMEGKWLKLLKDVTAGVDAEISRIRNNEQIFSDNFDRLLESHRGVEADMAIYERHFAILRRVMNDACTGKGLHTAKVVRPRVGEVDVIDWAWYTNQCMVAAQLGRWIHNVQRIDLFLEQRNAKRKIKEATIPPEEIVQAKKEGEIISPSDEEVNVFGGDVGVTAKTEQVG